MKTFAILSLGLCLAWPLQAQLFSSEALTGAAFGGLAGGIIGHNSGRRTGEGIAIGAGSGLLLGSLFHNSRRDAYYNSYAPGPPVYDAHYYRRPNYAWSGAALGGLAGGIIGHNSGRRTGEGILIGAGAGLLLGSVTEQNARRGEAAYVSTPPHYYVAPTDTDTENASPPPSVTALPEQQPINNNSGSSNPMSSANRLFGR